MTVTSKELNNLLQIFSVQHSPDHILTLALMANESSITEFKQQTVTFDKSSWDLLSQYADNSSSLGYATNDTFSNITRVGGKPRTSTEIPIWLIPCYSIILIFAVVGNLLVASTLFQNRRMRTITNVFLANLAISDMLLGVLCMPITLVGTYLRHFIFGELVCKFIQFAQAASVGVSSWTLVAISCERYYAICHPLRSRTWQTINHAYKIIGCIWFGSIICMAPIAIFSQLIPTSREGLRKCREQWPEEAVGYERSYNIFLDLALLVLPLAILCVAYILITRTLYMGIKDEKALIFGSKNNNVSNSGSGNSATGDTKFYAQVVAQMKTPAVFHLNISKRNHTRKGHTSANIVPNVNTSCTNNDEIFETCRRDDTNRSREAKYFTSSGVEQKFLAMGTISPSAELAVYNRKGFCRNSPGNSQAETEVSFNEAKEQSDNRQTQATLRQHCSDDVTQISSHDSRGTEAATTVAQEPALKDARCPQLHRLQSASIKSLNRNSIAASRNTQDAEFVSSFSLNTVPTAYLTRNQQRQESCHQKHHHQQQAQQLLQLRQAHKATEFTEKHKLTSMPSLRIRESALRRSNLEKNLESKKRVVKMLFVLVLEFFICWTPLYVINTMAMFIGHAIYEYVDYTTISFFQLLAYSSSCCNPITYCFMNASFRRAFVDTFKGMNLNKHSVAGANLQVAGNSIALANSCTIMTTNTVLDSPRL